MHHWHLITRFGEVQILLPAALFAALALLRRPQTRSIALSWTLSLSAALLLTAASKVAFIGWGIGWPESDFTGISGHAMVAAAVYPILLGALASSAPALGQRAAIGAGHAMALLVGASRIALGEHSGCDVLAGLLVGGAASAMAPDLVHLPRAVIDPALPVAVALWLALAPVLAPVSLTHSAVTRLSLALSGHKAPYTRSDMMRELRSGHGVAGSCQEIRPETSAEVPFW